MNYLQLCQRTRQECSISGSGPVTVASQSGEMKKIVDWVLTAYEDIQGMYATWDFLRFDFSFQTIASSSTYLPSAVSLTELAQWKEDSLRIYLTATGVSDEQHLEPQDWTAFKDFRLIGVIPTGKPSEFAIRPNNAIVLYQTPDAIYTVVGEYFKRPQTMTANADEPLIPNQFQMAIVWKAAMYYAADQGAAELYATAEREFKRVMRRLKRDQLPAISMAGALL